MKTDALVAALPEVLGDKLAGVTVALGEVTAVVSAEALPESMRVLRDRPELRFESMIDLCGVDYSTYGGGGREGPAFCRGVSPAFAREQLAIARSRVCAG